MCIFPVGDKNPTKRQPYVTYIIITLNVMIFLTLIITKQLDNAIQSYGLSTSDPQPYAYFTYMFLHKFPVIGIFSMLFLYMMGDNIEDEFGHLCFLFFYLLSGAFVGFIYTRAFPGASDPVIGSYEAVSAVIAAYIILYPRNKIGFIYIDLGTKWNPKFEALPFELPSIVAIVFWFAINIIGLFFVAGAALYGNYIYSTHIAGFITGAVVTGMLVMLGVKKVYWHREKDQADVDGTRPDSDIIETVEDDRYKGGKW